MDMRYPSIAGFDVSGVLSPPRGGDTRSYVSTSLLLTALLVFVVPILAIIGGLPLLPLVAVAGVVYALFVVWTGALFEGLSSALFVLVVFNANVPILDGPGIAEVDVFLMDVVLVPTLAFLLYWEYTDSRTHFSRTKTAAVGFLSFFVLWSFLSAAVANGPSQSAAFMFAVSQLRYVAIVVAAALVIRRTNIWCGIYPLAIAVGGNALFALAQVVNDGPFGLSYLGELGRDYISRVVFGPVILHSGTHIGGFAGSSRTLAGVLLLIFPVVVFHSLNRSRWKTVLAGSYVLVTVFIVRMSESDAGWAALVLTLLLSMGVLSYYSYRESERRYLSGVFTFALGIGFSLALYASRFTGSAVGEPADTAGSSESPAGGASSGSSSPGAEGAQPSPTIETSATEFVSSIPFVESSTFSVRLQQYVGAIDIASTYPLFGIGGSNFYLLAESIGLPRAFAVHNTFLAHLAATGFPGAIAYIVSISIVLFVALRRAFFGSGDNGLFWGLLAAGMIGFHALAFWITIHNSVVGYGVFWAVSGIVLGAERNHDYSSVLH